MRTITFKRHRFPPEIIRHSVWLYARFTLSFRDVEDLLSEWVSFLKTGSGGHTVRLGRDGDRLSESLAISEFDIPSSR